MTIQVGNEIDQILGKPPKNTLNNVVNAFMKKYPDKNALIKITGDRSSKKEDVKLEKGVDFFKLIEDQLRLSGYRNVNQWLPNKNPNVINRIAYANAVFSGDPRVKGVILTLHPDCGETISDVAYCPENKDGKKAKVITKDPVSKLPYEKYGHLSDTMDYVFIQFFSDLYNTYLYGGKKNLVQTFHKPKSVY